MTQHTRSPEQAVGVAPDIDPFEVLDVPPLRTSVPTFLVTLPLTLAGLVGAFTLAPLLLPFYRKFPLALKDRAARMVLFWLMLAAKFRIEVLDHNDSVDDHAQLYIAPHICMLEPLALMRVLGHIRPVAAAMSKDLPIFNRFIDATDPIYIERIKEKNKGPSVIEQLRASIETTAYRHLMFPEGTYTNGKTLLEFKVGAFAVGTPITPVVFHFPKGAPFWNRDESGFATQLYRLAASFGTPITIEFLPTYHGSQEEFEDPTLYADNLRALLSRHTGRPLSDKSLYDSPNYKADVSTP